MTTQINQISQLGIAFNILFLFIKKKSGQGLRWLEDTSDII